MMWPKEEFLSRLCYCYKLQSYLLSPYTYLVLGIKEEVHKSEGGKSSDSRLSLELPPTTSEAASVVCFAGFALAEPASTDSLHSALALYYIEAVDMEAVWAALADKEVEAGHSNEGKNSNVVVALALCGWSAVLTAVHAGLRQSSRDAAQWAFVSKISQKLVGQL